ncbi:MAG: LTA synthase family protein [Aminipila sp.]
MKDRLWSLISNLKKNLINYQNFNVFIQDAYPKIKEFFSKRRKAVVNTVILLIILILAINPFGSSYIKSITNQEFFTYHIKDLAKYLVGDSKINEDYYLATGTYEKQKDGEYFGIAKGRNVIMVQMESFQNMMIGAEYYGQELTPFLNDFINDESTIYFDNFYSQIGGGNTSDAELATNNSLFGSIESYSYQLFEDNYFRGLPWILKEQGYSTSVMHGYKKEFWNRENIYPNLGIDKYFGNTEYKSDNIKGIGGGNIVGISDSEFFKQSVDYMKTLKEPYYNMLITLSTHNPFQLPKQLSEIKLREEDKNLVGQYYDSIHYSDKSLGEFIERLKEEGLYDNSIIVMYGDHFGLSKADSNVDELVSKWLGHEYTYDNMANVPLIIHIPGEDVKQTVSISGGQTDIMPTLAYLMGIENLDTLYLGQNLLTAKEGFAPIQIHMIKGSFIKDDIVFEMSRDGVFSHSRAWNRKTLEPIDISGLEDDSLRAKEKIELSHFYLYNDVLRMALEDGKDMDKILSALNDDKKLPKTLDFVYVDSNKEKDLENLANILMENPKKYIMLSSDDLVGTLNMFYEEYSGKSGKVGSIKKIDEKQNQLFESMKSRIVPLMQNTTNYSKVEYLGYEKILLMPDFESNTVSEIQAFVEANKPYGIVIDINQGLWQKDFAQSIGISKIYAYSKDGIGLFQKIKLKGKDIYGIIN